MEQVGKLMEKRFQEMIGKLSVANDVQVPRILSAYLPIRIETMKETVNIFKILPSWVLDSLLSIWKDAPEKQCIHVARSLLSEVVKDRIEHQNKLCADCDGDAIIGGKYCTNCGSYQFTITEL